MPGGGESPSDTGQSSPVPVEQLGQASLTEFSLPDGDPNVAAIFLGVR